MQKHLLIISHRRSGTHLTIDTIRNNFSNYTAPYTSITQLYKRKGENEYVKRFVERMEKEPRVFKSHTIPDVESYYNNAPKIISFVSDLINNHKVIYVYRDGRDVLTSLFYHEEANEKYSLSEFIRLTNKYNNHAYEGDKNKIEYWEFHKQEWLKRKKTNAIHFVKYEDLISDYESTVKSIAQFLNHPISKIVDVRLKNKPGVNNIPNWTNKDVSTINYVSYTPVNFRKGGIGDYKQHFTESDLILFDKITNEHT